MAWYGLQTVESQYPPLFRENDGRRRPPFVLLITALGLTSLLTSGCRVETTNTASRPGGHQRAAHNEPVSGNPAFPHLPCNDFEVHQGEEEGSKLVVPSVAIDDLSSAQETALLHSRAKAQVDDDADGRFDRTYTGTFSGVLIPSYKQADKITITLRIPGESSELHCSDFYPADHS